MAREIELDELFAYLDQLELNERLEQEQVDVSLALGHPVADIDAASGNQSLPRNMDYSGIGNERIRGVAHKQDVQEEHQGTGSAESTSPSPHVTPDFMTPDTSSPSAQPLERETIPSDPTSPNTTPPKRRTVQFDSATPLKTPQRRAPKLVFTPLRATQFINEGRRVSSPPQPEKQVLEGVVLSPPDRSFLGSFVSVDVEVHPSTPFLADGGAEVFSEPTESINESAMSSTVDVLDDVDDDDERGFDPASPSQPTRIPRRQTKKRIVYSSDEESSPPPMRISKPSAVSREDLEEIEYVGETAIPVELHETVVAPTTPPLKNVKRGRKAAEGVSVFIDAMARAAGKDEDDEDSDEAGSLDDFIVDDDYVEYEDADEEQEGNAYVLTYSPTTPKLRRVTAQTKSITVDLTETSDEETSEPAIPTASTGTRVRPKPRARQPPAKAVQTPSKNRAEKKTWNDSKQALALQIMDELDELVFERKLVAEWKVAPVWNNKLLTTAGRAHHKRIRLSDGTCKHEGRIELSEKVIDDEDKLKNTVAHEMCHLATWIISGEMKNPHGAVFKSWGKKVMKARKDITVTTKHSYEIAYKYEWECTTETCDAVYRRHSKSIDPEKQACGKCRGRLRPLFKTRGAGSGSTPFQDFLKQNMKLAKAAMPKATHGEVMRALSERWKASGGAKTPAEILQTGEDPLAVQRAHAEHWQVLSLQMQALSIS